MALGLSISDLINVTVSFTPLPSPAVSVNSMLIIGSSDVIDTIQRMRTYTTLREVAVDFATTSPEYLAADLWFSQDPQPALLYIGRWARSATHGALVGDRITPTNQLISSWTSISDGSFNVTFDQATVVSVSNLNFDGQTNLNGVAAIIQDALFSADVPAPASSTVVWDSTFQRFIMRSGTTGTTSSVSFMSELGSGTDIAVKLAMRSIDTGAYVADGVASETALGAVEKMDDLFGATWYAVSLLGGIDADYLDIAAYIEADNPHHFQVITTAESAVVSSVDTTSLAYVLKQAGYNRTTIQYSSTTPYAAVSMIGRILTTRWNSPNSTITLMYKIEPGVTAEIFNETQMRALLSKNCNVYVRYDNDTHFIQPGVVSSGQFVDTVVGADWLLGRITARVFNLFYTTPKVPQTDAGMNMIKTVIESVCVDGVTNGYVAPGTWTGGGVGEIDTGDYLSKGYYVYMPPIATQDQADRAARIAVPFTVLLKLGGAVHTADVAITLNP